MDKFNVRKVYESVRLGKDVDTWWKELTSSFHKYHFTDDEKENVLTLVALNLIKEILKLPKHSIGGSINYDDVLQLFNYLNEVITLWVNQ